MTILDQDPRVRLCAMLRASSLSFIFGGKDCNVRSLLFSVLRYQRWARPRHGSAMFAQVVNKDGDTPSRSKHCCTEHSKDRRCEQTMQRHVIFAKSMFWQFYPTEAPPGVRGGCLESRGNLHWGHVDQ